jgi:hypothetical protein
MCEFSGKLIAWLDGELPAENAAHVEGHLEFCAECRSRVEAYRQVTIAFDQYCDAYCDAVVALMPSRKGRRRVLRAWEAAALAAAAIAALFLFVARQRVGFTPVTDTATGAPIAQPLRVVRAPENAQRLPVSPAPGAEMTASSRQSYDANALAAESALEIAIPADALLPPGAAPEGLSFDADVTIAPDGSAQQIRLRPELTGFERRSSQP